MVSKETGASALRAVLLVVELVNTRRADGDEIATPEALCGWLRVRGMAPPGLTVTAVHHERALVVREGLRAILAANNRPPPGTRLLPSGRADGLDPAALPKLAALARDLPLMLNVTSVPPRLVPLENGTVNGTLASLLAAVAEAMASGEWSRVKACREPSCRWAYYDQSRNQSRAWCSMDICGNRSKARAFRHRGAQAATDGR